MSSPPVFCQDPVERKGTVEAIAVLPGHEATGPDIDMNAVAPRPTGCSNVGEDRKDETVVDSPTVFCSPGRSIAFADLAGRRSVCRPTLRFHVAINAWVLRSHSRRSVLGQLMLEIDAKMTDISSVFARPVRGEWSRSIA